MSYKNQPSITERIEWLGQLNDRRLEANHTGDLDELERIASEYAARPYMQNTANEIRITIAVRRAAVASHRTETE